MKKHWTKFLTEADKYALMYGDDQEERMRKIIALQSEITSLHQEYISTENSIHDAILENWTAKEIAQAKHQATNQ